MQFQKLTIEQIRWGEDAGKLIATIDIRGKKTSATMQLPESVGDEILKLAKYAIIDGMETAANEVIFEMTTLIPDQLKLEDNSKQP